MVYLDNARTSTMTARQWSSVLASLSKKGWYKHDDDKEFKGVFGYIKLGATPDCF